MHSNYHRNTSNWTGRTPRTLVQAFGAYAGRTPRPRPSRLSQIIGALACAALVVAVTTYAFIVATN